MITKTVSPQNYLKRTKTLSIIIFKINWTLYFFFTLSYYLSVGNKVFDNAQTKKS